MKELVLLVVGTSCVLIGVVDFFLAHAKRHDLLHGWRRTDVFHRLRSHREYNGRQLVVEAAFAMCIGVALLWIRFS